MRRVRVERVCIYIYIWIIYTPNLGLGIAISIRKGAARLIVWCLIRHAVHAS